MTCLVRVFVAIVLLAVAGSAAANTRAWLDRDRIALGETATLNIETDTGTAPDYGPLVRDFDLSGHASRRQLQWANGRVSDSTLYAVALRPRRDGLLRLPPLRVGGDATAPLVLLVTRAPVPSVSAGNAEVFIESEADDQDPYVQQTVGWVVRLYSAIPLIAGQLEQPEPAGASLQRVGEDVQYRRTVGSRAYVVTERRYLLIPERSGELVVPPARFEGRGTGNAFDQLFGDGQTPLRAAGRPRVLKVRPIPADAPQPWLPLRGLTLRYLATPTQARAGEASHVVVELQADGATAAQLPELQFAPVDGVQLFPERAQSDDSMADGRPQVRLQRRIAIVPTRAGTLVLPGPRIDWWDSRAGAARTAQLPPLTLQVQPGAQPATRAIERAAATSGPSTKRDAPVAVFAALAAIAVTLVLAGLAWRRRARAVAGPSGTAHTYVRTGVNPEAAARPASAPASMDVPTPRPLATTREPATPPTHTADAPPNLPRLLQMGDLADIDAGLRRLAGPHVVDLDGVIARLDDAA
ncbi:MAG TPA: BatD family protein, partial [Lysobacter sp.]|nr:BatD family protein [Lysobacter sp.]